MELKIADEFDSISRAETKLIKMFGLVDTDEEREFGLLFWTSIYLRATEPGHREPTPMLLVGPRGSGKSQFIARLNSALGGEFVIEYKLPWRDSDGNFQFEKYEGVSGQTIAIFTSCDPKDVKRDGFHSVVIERVDYTDFEEDVPKIMAECGELVELTRYQAANPEKAKAQMVFLKRAGDSVEVDEDF
jgi:predicted P-loop ATPase